MSNSSISSATDDEFSPQKKYGRFNRKRKDIDVNSCTGLRHVTFQVLQKLQSKKQTTYEQVAQELAKDFVYSSNGSQEVKEEKNMRRRAYDVMNVLIAVGHLKKSGKKLSYVGQPTRRNLDALLQEKEVRLNRIEAKKQELEELRRQLAGSKALMDRNKFMSTPAPNEAVYMPFNIITTKRGTQVDCSVSQDRSSFKFEFASDFKVYNDVDVLIHLDLISHDEVNLKMRELSTTGVLSGDDILGIMDDIAVVEVVPDDEVDPVTLDNFAFDVPCSNGILEQIESVLVTSKCPETPCPDSGLSELEPMDYLSSPISALSSDGNFSHTQAAGGAACIVAPAYGSYDYSTFYDLIFASSNVTDEG
ncbi:Transcription factor Dp-1 [Halotydeus destructor]|nr:Transcription factor Dp-1 [Halotydeus destructor]